jgi:hypothetical protein
MSGIGPGLAARLDRPLGRGLTLAVGAILLALPARLLWDQLESFRLRQDDFAYLIDCRSGAEPLANLWAPHNAHVVPLFRLLTAGVARLPGGMGTLAWRLGLANYLGLVLLLMAVGHLVAWETRRMAAGYAAMVLAGVTTVLEPAATWYAAGQTTWAALGVVGTLVLLQFGRVWPHAGWLVGAALSAALAPLFWTGGLVAGPAGSAYLWAAGRRRAAAVPMLGTLATAGLILAVAGRQLAATAGEGPSAGVWAPFWGLVYTLQAIPESLILAGFGLDGAVEAVQGAVFVAAILVAWAWSRGGVRPGPLEASGVVTTVLAYAMAFTLRAGYRFDDLRALGWYDTIPLAGAVLFAMGWWAGAPGEPGRPRPLTRRGALAVAALAALAFVLHAPRAERILIRESPPLLPSELRKFPISSLQRLRALYVDDEQAGRQERALIRLGEASEVARRAGIGKDAIRAAFGRVEVPDWPRAIRERDALDLLPFPETGPERNPARVRRALGVLLAPEPWSRPEWIEPGGAWPPGE